MGLRDSIEIMKFAIFLQQIGSSSTSPISLGTEMGHYILTLLECSLNFSSVSYLKIRSTLRKLEKSAFSY